MSDNSSIARQRVLERIQRTPWIKYSPRQQERMVEDELKAMQAERQAWKTKADKCLQAYIRQQLSR